MLQFKRHKAQPAPAHLHWTYTKISPGTSLFGWIAGPVIAVKTHWFAGASKPCWIELMEGQTFCPYCDSVKGLIPQCKKPRYSGYTPLILRDGRRAVICISETLGPTVEKLHCQTQVEFSRSNGSRDPLRVKLFGSLEQKPCPEKWPSLMGYDISEWLVKLWSDDALAVVLMQREAALASSTEAVDKTEQNKHSPTSVPAPRSSTSAVIPPGGLAAELARRASAEVEVPAQPLELPAAIATVRSDVQQLLGELVASTSPAAEQSPPKPSEPSKNGKKRKK
jgi:hypothetical protein